ncbi:MAG: hypothetical protein ACSLFE_02965 [Gemmatimonadaceae bacterium]
MRFGRMAPLALGCIAVAASACGEKLETTVGCPELCPGQGIDVINITIDPVVLDTTVTFADGFGTEPSMLLASRGDTLDSRVIMRFDGLPRRYRRVLADTTTTEITTIDSAFLRLRLDLTEKQADGEVTVSVYDMETDADDTSAAALLPLFSPERLVGSQAFAPADLTDSVRIPLVNSAVLASIRANARVRIGLRITGATGQFHVLGTESGTPAMLSFRVSPDTVVSPLTFNPLSQTPTDSEALQIAFADFRLLVRTPPDGSPVALRVGALPSKRSYLRFLLPSGLLDSASVVRATLLLTQMPNRGLGPLDSVSVVTQLSTAGTVITDPALAARLVAPPELTQIDSLRVAATDSGARQIDIAPIVRIWLSAGDTLFTRAIVLRSAREGISAADAWFFSIEAPAALRPRLRISYTPANPFGLP